jgi:LacI family transcriptional regulator
MRVTAAELVASLEEERSARDEIQDRSQALAHGHARHGSSSDCQMIAFVPLTRLHSASPCPFLAEIAEGVESRARASGWDVAIFTVADGSYVERCRRHDIGGVVFHGRRLDDPFAEDLIAAGIPCAVIDGGGIDTRVAHVRSDNVAAAAAAVKHLYQHGRRQIATIAGHMSPGAERLLGFRAALEELGLPDRPEYVVPGDFFHESGIRGMRQLLTLREQPDAVFVAGDVMAIGAMSVIEEVGLSVPDDIAVVGFDDLEIASMVSPQLTTMRQDMRGLGAAAAEALLCMIDEPAASPPQLLLDVELVLRESCGQHETAPQARDWLAELGVDRLPRLQA